MTTNDRDETYAESDDLQKSKPGDVSQDASVRTFDLRSEIDQLRQGRTIDHVGPSGKTLLKEQDLRIVLMALKASGRMEEHSASGPISIQVLEGAVRVHLANDQIDLGPGHLLAIGSAVRHDVEAQQDSMFLLTIGRTRYEHVSDSHERRA